MARVLLETQLEPGREVKIMAKGRPSKSGKARSAITGHYVTKQTAVRHPRTTVVEGKKK